MNQTSDPSAASAGTQPAIPVELSQARETIDKLAGSGLCGEVLGLYGARGYPTS